MEVIAVRSINIGGVAYMPGDTVPDLPSDKVAQLVAQRWLRVNNSEGPAEYVALRPFSIKGKQLIRGDRVRVSKLPIAKLYQLLEQRYLEPVPPPAQ